MYIRKIKNLAGQISIKEEVDEDKLDSLYSNINEKLILENWNRFLAHTNYSKESPKICRHIYKYYMLLWNGDFVPCCIDFNGTMIIGNVINDNLNLNDLFYGDRYKIFRSKMEKLDYEEFPLCRKCNDYFKA